MHREEARGRVLNALELRFQNRYGASTDSIGVRNEKLRRLHLGYI